MEAAPCANRGPPKQQDPLPAKKEAPSMEDTSPTPGDRKPAPFTGGKWATAHEAMRSWGTTARFCIIVVVINIPLLILLIIQR